MCEFQLKGIGSALIRITQNILSLVSSEERGRESNALCFLDMNASLEIKWVIFVDTQETPKLHGNN